MPDKPYETNEWESVLGEEHALLQRCEKFVLSVPDAPGNSLGQNAKNILYLTPCGRWLRICSREFADDSPHPANIEVAFLVSPTGAEGLFQQYARDFLPLQLRALKDDAIRRRADRAFWDFVKEDHPDYGGLRDSFWSDPSQPIPCHKLETNRNTLVHLLKELAKEWPPETVVSATGTKTDADIDDISPRVPVKQEVPSCSAEQDTPNNLPKLESSSTEDRHKRDYLRVMRTLNKPVTQSVLKREIRAIAKNPPFEGATSVNNTYLAQLNKTDYVNNNRGYSLTSQGEKLADRLLSEDPRK